MNEKAPATRGGCISLASVNDLHVFSFAGAGCASYPKCTTMKHSLYECTIKHGGVPCPQRSELTLRA